MEFIFHFSFIILHTLIKPCNQWGDTQNQTQIIPIPPIWWKNSYTPFNHTLFLGKIKAKPVPTMNYFFSNSCFIYP